ncbi:MAG: DUF1648 domain-containing protein [Acidimicrobiia bacterium]
MKAYSRLLGWGAGWAVVAVVLFAVALPELPDRVAIHWDSSGVADGSAPRWAIPVAAVAIVLLGCGVSSVFSVSREPSMEAFALVGMSGGLSTAIVLVTTTLNAGVRDWTQAPAIGTAGIVILFALPTLGLVVGAILGRHWYPIKSIPRQVTEVIEVEPGERVSWVGRARVRGVALVVFGLAVLLLFLRPGLPLWVFVLIAGFGVVFSQVEAQVTNDGMRVRLGGIPVRNFPLDRISSARAIAVDPAAYGGSGWKKVPGQYALILRAGEAIAITFRDGSQFVVTVDDPETGAALLNGLIERNT